MVNMVLTLRRCIKWSKGDLYFIMLVAWYTTSLHHVYCFGLTERMEPPTTSIIFILLINDNLIALLSYKVVERREGIVDSWL